MEILLGKNKKFFKANLHTHSYFSDGKLSPKELKKEYMKRGYSILAFTDHEHIIDNSRLSDSDFLAITGCEIAIKELVSDSTLKNPAMKVCHLNFYSLDPHNTVTPFYSKEYDHFINIHSAGRITPQQSFKRIYSTDGINEIINAANEQGFLVSYNHPSWSLETAVDYTSYKNLFAVEIYNTTCKKLGFTDDEAAYDHLLRGGNRLFCTACDDCHTKAPIGSPYNDSFGGWVMIDAEALNYGTVMEALKRGDFYSSTGPEILEIAKNSGTISIKTSPAKSITMLTGGRRTEVKFAEENSPLTSAEFKLKAHDGYVRIRVEDYCAKKAYSNAYFID